MPCGHGCHYAPGCRCEGKDRQGLIPREAHAGVTRGVLAHCSDVRTAHQACAWGPASTEGVADGTMIATDAQARTARSIPLRAGCARCCGDGRSMPRGCQRRHDCRALRRSAGGTACDQCRPARGAICRSADRRWSRVPRRTRLPARCRTCGRTGHPLPQDSFESHPSQRLQPPCAVHRPAPRCPSTGQLMCYYSGQIICY